MLPALFMTLFFAIAPSHARTEVAPTNSNEAVLVSWPGGDAIYYPLNSGGRLDYAVRGPIQLVVEVRQRFATSSAVGRPGELRAYGDGIEFMNIEVKANKYSEASGNIQDDQGGFPSKKDIARFEVPAGGEILTLKAPSSGPNYLVRIVTQAGGDAVIASGAGTLVSERPLDQSPPKAKPAAAPEGPWGTGDASLDDLAVDDTPETPEEGALAGVDAEGEEGAFVARPSAGAEMGIGVPARGTMAVPYVGVLGLYPLVEDLVDLQLSIGWYRIGVETDLPITDHYAGSFSYSNSWKTSVFPISVSGAVHPLDIGPVGVFATGGLGAFLSRRTTDGASDKTGGASLGAQLGLGAMIEAGPGTIRPSLVFRGARKGFGNTGEDGAEVRESLTAVVTNVGYTYTF